MNSGSSDRPAAAAVERMSMRFGRTTAVDDLSFAVAPGTVYALLGRNGSGKSTTVRCLLGQLRPTAGTAFLLGVEAWSGRHRAMARVGVVPETPDVPPEMTARRAAAFVQSLHARWDGDGYRERLGHFGVPMDVPFGRLSKGQRKQVCLALALATSPDLVILDDPTLGLDPVARRSLFEELISDLADRGTTVLLTTHDLPGVEGVADRVGVIDEGRLLLDEPLESVKARFRRVHFPASAAAPLAEVLEDLGLLSERVVQGMHEAVLAGCDGDTAQRLAAVLGEQPAPRIDAMSLEDIFIALCGEGRGGAS